MTYQLANAKVWDGSAWVEAVGGASPWWQTDLDYVSSDMTTFANVTANASAHTKGAWVQLVASTAANADVLILNVACAANATNTAALIDVGIGASGAETVIIPNLAVGGSDGNGSWYITLPVKIPAGSRLAARSQTVRTGGVNIAVRAVLQSSAKYDDAPTTVDVIGTSTATSEGVATVTNNTYVELTSSSSQEYNAVVVVPSLTSTSTGATQLLVDLATGASGSETIAATHRLQTNTAEACSYRNPALLAGYAAGPFPSGTRFAVRVSAEAGNLDFCLVGIP